MGAAPGPSVSMMVKDLTPMIVTFESRRDGGFSLPPNGR
jgi:hypothetical protein